MFDNTYSYLSGYLITELWSLGPQHKEGEANMNRKWGLNWQKEAVPDREKEENVSSGGYALWLFFPVFILDRQR